MPKRKTTPTKLDELTTSCTLNKRHNDVLDELFQDSHFFDSRDLIQVKYEMLRRVRKDQWSVTKAAETFGFSRFVYYETEANFNARGLVGLLPKKKGPKRSHKLTDDMLVFLNDLVGEQDYGPEELADIIQDRFATQVHPRSIGRAMIRWKKKRWKKRTRRVVP